MRSASTTATKILEHIKAKITEASVAYVGSTSSYEIGYNRTKTISETVHLAGVLKSNHKNGRSTGEGIFRAMMHEERFLFLISTIRFEYPTTRKNRINNRDKLVGVYNIINNNCSNYNYSCSECAAVDEMFFGFRGRRSFWHYITNLCVFEMQIDTI